MTRGRGRGRGSALAVVAAESAAVEAPPARAGAWTRDAGAGCVATRWAHIPATGGCAGDGATQPIPPYARNAGTAPGGAGMVRPWRGLAVGAGCETALRARAAAAGNQVHASASDPW